MTAIFRDIEGNLMPTPKARSFTAIRRESMTAARRYHSPTGRDGLAMRAVQYVLAMQGAETKHQEYLYNAQRYCEFDRAPDGSTRVRAVKGICNRYEIPHWDFVAAEINEGAFS